MALEPAQPRKIAITGHKYELTEQDIKREFERFGEILEIIFKVNKETGKSKGFTFIEYRDESSAKDAILTMNQTMLHGRKIYVDYARMHRNDDNFNFNHSPTRVPNNSHRSGHSNYGIEYFNYFERPRKQYNNDYPANDCNSFSGRQSHELRSSYSPTLGIPLTNNISFPPFGFGNDILSHDQSLKALHNKDDSIHSQIVPIQSDTFQLSPNLRDLEINQSSIHPQSTSVSLGGNSESWEQEDGEIPPGPQDRKNFETLEEGEMPDDKSLHASSIVTCKTLTNIFDPLDNLPNTNKDSVNLQNMQFDEKTNRLLEIIRMQGTLAPEPNEAQLQWAKGGLRNKEEKSVSKVHQHATITSEITNVYDLTPRDETSSNVHVTPTPEILIGPPPPHTRNLSSELKDNPQCVSLADPYPQSSINHPSPNPWSNNRFQNRFEFPSDPAQSSYSYDSNFRNDDQPVHQDHLPQRPPTWSGDPNMMNSSDPTYGRQDWNSSAPHIPEQEHSHQYLRNSAMSGMNLYRDDISGTMSHSMNQHSSGVYSDSLNHIRHSCPPLYPLPPHAELNVHSQLMNPQIHSTNLHQNITSPLDYNIQQPFSNNLPLRSDTYSYPRSSFHEQSLSHPQSNIHFSSSAQVTFGQEHNQLTSFHIPHQYQDSSLYPHIGQTITDGSKIQTTQSTQQYPQIVPHQIHPSQENNSNPISNYINPPDKYSNAISPTLHAQATIAQATVTADKCQDLSRSKDPTTLMSRMYVGGIDMKVITKEQLIDAFRIYGRILDVKLHNHFAFVQFDNPYSCMDAIYSAQETVINGHTLKLQLSSDGQRARNEFLASKNNVPLPPDPKDVPPNSEYPNPFKGQGQQLPAFLAVAETPPNRAHLNINPATDTSLVNPCNTVVPISIRNSALTHSPAVQIHQMIQQQASGPISLHDQPQLVPTLIANPLIMNPNAASQLQNASATIGIDAATLASIIGSFPIASKAVEDSKTLSDPILPLMDLNLGGSQIKLSVSQAELVKDVEGKKHKKESKKKKRSEVKKEEKKRLSESKKANEEAKQKVLKKRIEELNLVKAKLDSNKCVEQMYKEKSSNKHHLKLHNKKFKQHITCENKESTSKNINAKLIDTQAKSHGSKKQFREHKDRHILRSADKSLNNIESFTKPTTQTKFSTTEKSQHDVINCMENTTCLDDSVLSIPDSVIKPDKDKKHYYSGSQSSSNKNIKKEHKNPRLPSSSPVFKHNKKSKLSHHHSKAHSHTLQNSEDMWDEYAYYYDMVSSNPVQKLQKDYYAYYVSMYGYDFNHWNTEFHKYLEEHHIDDETKEMVMNLQSLMSSYPSYYSDNYYSSSRMLSSQQHSDEENNSDNISHKDNCKYPDFATPSHTYEEK